MYKRLIALASTVFILFSTLTYAEDGALYLSDNIIDMVSGNADYQYNCANELLNALGIMEGYEDTSYARYADINRADFAVLTARTLNLNIHSAISGNVFDDVKPDYYAAGAISVLKGMNLISGDGDNCFRPDEPIKLSEAVKILCVGIGYNHYADTSGGYVNGYLAAANEADLLKNIKIGSNDTLTKNEAVFLLFNVMNASMVKQTQSGYAAKFEVVPDKTILTEYHDVYYVDGIIKSNKITALSVADTSKNSIEVGDMSLSCEDISVKEYLGYNARVYYRQTSQDQDVVCVMAKNTNKELIIEDDDADAEYISGKNEIQYYEAGGRVKNAKLESNFKLIYNGKAEGNYNSVLNDLSGAYIRLLDNNNNGYYDVVFITKYRNVVVKAVNLTNEIVYDIYSSKNNWDYSNSDDAIINITDSKGKALTVSDILPWQVLSIVESNDGEYVDVLILENYVYGTITQIVDGNKYIIDGKEYKVAENFANYGNQNIYTGLNASFCLDKEGKIAAIVKEDDGVVKYGLLIKAWNDNDEDYVNVKLYSQDGAVRKFECAEKVNTGSQTLKKNDLYNQIKNISDQLVRYSVNKEGKLNRLEFAAQEPDFNKNAEYNGFYQYKAEDLRKYRKTVSTFNDDFLINGQTLIFGLYSNYQEEDDKYRIMEAGNLSNDLDYTISAYTDQANPAFADVVCIKFDNDTENFDWSPFAVTKITEKVNEDGYIVNELSGYNVEGFVVTETEDTTVLSSAGVVAGDIIRIKRNTNGQVNEAVKLYNSTTGTMIAASSGFNAKAGYHFICPYAISENTLKYTEGDASSIKKESQLKQKLMNMATIVITSPHKDEAYTKGNLNDIVTYMDDNTNYSKVFMFSNYAEARLIVVIK